MSTTFYSIKKDRTPGPVALIRFQIWSIGRVVKEHIEQRLENAIRHALWDLLMEYRALTLPISDTFQQDDSSCYSEPTTPIRARRSGRAIVDQNFQFKELQTSKEISSSVPDMTAKAHSPQSSFKDISLFKFSNGPQSAKPEFHGPSSLPTQESDDKHNLNLVFHSVMKSFLHYGDKLGCPSLSKQIFTLPSRHSIIYILKEIQNSIRIVMQDMFPTAYMHMTNPLNAETDFIPFNPQINGEEDILRPGMTKSYIIIARNIKQWKAYMGMCDFSKFHENFNETLKSFQKFQTHVCNLPNIDSLMDSVPNSPSTIARSNSISALASPRLKNSNIHDADSSSQIMSQPSFVPRQRLLIMYVHDKELMLFLYNCSQDITGNLLKHLNKLIQWHDTRDCFLNNIMLQKLGVFHGQVYPHKLEREKSIKEEKNEPAKEGSENVITWTSTFIDHLIHNHFPTKNSYASSTSSKSSSRKVSYILKTLKNARPRKKFHNSPSVSIKDPVIAHGIQFQEATKAQRRDMQELHNMWQSRGTSVSHSLKDGKIKRLARLSHYCMTPILFSPSWRWKLAPIRDHTIESLENTIPDHISDTGLINRSRHSSGSSLKNNDGAGTSSRSRRISGANHCNSNQSSPKLRMKNPSEETWHSTICKDYLQEYVQYLHSIGFVFLQRPDANQSGRRSLGNDDDKNKGSEAVSQSRTNLKGPPVFYLIKYVLGGLLVFEIGLSDPYAYGNLYSIECSRFSSYTPTTLSSQFLSAFLDELDKIKFLMHLHSFTYDYHLRTIHSYISGRRLIFRNGYHLISFLDDFIKYYQKAPNGVRNLLYAGTLSIPDTNIPADQLYNYIISHNPLYGMTVLRMIPVIVDTTSNIDTEYALVELSSQQASYKDVNDIFQRGSFDVGLLINHNVAESTSDSHSLVLNYYIILTSQRDLYPTLSSFGATLGSFQTVRFSSSQTTSAHSSRKTSVISMITEKEKLESSGEESSNSLDSKTNKTNLIKGMCDEDVTYLGYYSSQETMMQEVLLKQAESAQTHLRGVVNRASIHCRRDYLWSILIPKPLKEDGNKDHGSVSYYSDFAELLNLVTMIPLNDIDDKLTPFMNMHISWYQTLAPVLKSKYTDTHREFISSDGNSLYVAVTHQQCPDLFLLLAIDIRYNKTDLCLVFRESPVDLEHSAEKPNQRVLALQSLVEGFVNACCYHLWTSIL